MKNNKCEIKKNKENKWIIEKIMNEKMKNEIMKRMYVK